MGSAVPPCCPYTSTFPLGLASQPPCTRTEDTWDMLLACSQLWHLCSCAKMRQPGKWGEKYRCTWVMLIRDVSALLHALSPEEENSVLLMKALSVCLSSFLFFSFVSSSHRSSLLLQTQQHQVFYWSALSFMEPNYTAANWNPSCLLWTTWTPCGSCK